jgi:hypothetical protein
VKFKKNDIIQNGSSIAHVLSYDGGWYFVRWFDAGDGMLWAEAADKNYKKVMDLVPGSMDEFVFNGKVPFRK